MEQITSIKHEKVVQARSLLQQKERLKTGRFLSFGFEQIQWALKSSCRVEYCLLYDNGSRSLPESVPCYLCSEGILKKVTGTQYLIPAVAVVSVQKESAPSDIEIVFDGVRDFGNIGTIVRTAAAFGMESFVSTKSDFDLYQRKTIDASRGTVFDARCQNFDAPIEALQHLKARGCQVVATAMEGSQLQSLAKLQNKPVAIVFGNETNGVSQEVLDQADLIVQIPMATHLDSLNVGVAAGISLYELKLKMVLMMLNEKIRGSLGRNLYSTANWLRLSFDKALQEVCDLTGDQAILLMVLSCDERGDKKTLVKASGAFDNDPISPLVEAGYLTETGQEVTITDKGKELIAKIWMVHEKVENGALASFTREERGKLLQWLSRIQKNLEKEVPYSL